MYDVGYQCIWLSGKDVIFYERHPTMYGNGNRGYQYSTALQMFGIISTETAAVYVVLIELE